jgi:protein-L-isoaspartate(D-aspartate) O-methyltransferase
VLIYTALEDTYKHQGLRKKLVKELHIKGINDEAVLKAIDTVPRHFFFPREFMEHAYKDQAFPIEEGQTISQPFTVAYQTEALNIKPGDKVLEIGTGSGYQTCVLLEMGAEVFTIEFHEKLYLKAKKTLQAMNYNATFYHGDGSKGLEQHAPFDKIIVTAGAPVIPNSLVLQLKIGGVMIIPVGNKDSQKMYRVVRTESHKIHKTELDSFRFVPLLGAEGWDGMN